MAEVRDEEGGVTPLPTIAELDAYYDDVHNDSVHNDSVYGDGVYGDSVHTRVESSDGVRVGNSRDGSEHLEISHTHDPSQPICTEQKSITR